MPNRVFEESVLFRSMVKDYIDSTRSPSLYGAVDFVNARCAEQGIVPPSQITISKLLKQNGIKPQRWTWGRA